MNMSPRLKIILGTLVLIAGFMVVRVGLYFKNDIQSTNLSHLGIVLSESDVNPFFVDSDGDGIADVDEAYYRTDPFNPDTDGDGFLDGEEVVSGFNPGLEDPDATRIATTNVTDNLT